MTGSTDHRLLGWQWAPPPLPDPSALRAQEPRFQEPMAVATPTGTDPKIKGALLLAGGVFCLLLVGSSAVFLIPALGLAGGGALVFYNAANSPTNPARVVKTREDKWQEFLAVHAGWSDAILREEAAAQTKFEAAPRWYPIERLESARRLDVVGGSPAGWATLIRTGLAPLAMSGSPMTVLDLSGRDLAAALWADTHGVEAPRVVSLPSQIRYADPLVTSTRPWDVVSVVTQSDSASDDVARRDIEVLIIRRVAAALGNRVTLPRLLAAMTALLAPGSPRVLAELAVDERERLQDPDFLSMLGRDGMTHLSRLSAVLETMLADAAYDAPPTEPPQPLPCLPESGLAILAADRISDGETRRRLDNLLAASLADRVDAGAGSRGLLVVLGADRLSRQVLEVLVTRSEDRGIKLILFFEHLRGEAKEILGRGASDTVIMRLGNVDDATAAANFVGKQHRFVVSSITLQVGSQLGGSEGHGFGVTDTFGESYTSQSMGPDSSTSNSSRSNAANFNYSKTWSETKTYGETSTRSEEFVARAEDLQRIPTTGFLYVSAINGRQHVIFGDCHPAISQSQFVAAKAIARR